MNYLIEVAAYEIFVADQKVISDKNMTIWHHKCNGAAKWLINELLKEYYNNDNDDNDE